MSLLDLTLINLDKNGGETCSLREAIQKESLVVLLGSPGSGKTSLLEKYQHENPDDTQLLSVRVFLRPKTEVERHIKVLLLDGLDEFRCISNVEKTSVIVDLAEKINALEIERLVISCREMDWYGESDVESLHEIIAKRVSVFRILPLDDNQKIAFAKLRQIQDAVTFVTKFSMCGFLENPQLFRMLASVYKDKPEVVFRSKKELFQHFFSIARESNELYKRNKVNELEPLQILKLSGYCAAFFFFCSFDKLGEEFLDSICDKERGFPKDELEKTLKTSLFSEGRFSHRILAEFALANFLVEEIISDGYAQSIQKVMNLFVSNRRIPTELRGTYAWLCSLSENMDLIKEDPYYQAIHGDNSLLSYNQKMSIVLQVKEYAKSNPYFFKFEHTMDLEGFYSEELDDFLVHELSDGLSIKNHYCFFVINAMVTAPTLSTRMKDHLKGFITNPAVSSYLKSKMLKAFLRDVDFLNEVLKKIRDGSIQDSSDDIKEIILDSLYPDDIETEEIVSYLLLYHGRIGGYCFYLYKTPYKEKYSLIDRIFQSCISPNKKGHLALPPNVESFVSDYFLETCLLFEDTENPFTAKEIFGVIKHFKKYYGLYEPLKMESYRYAITDKQKISEEKLTRLGDDLFSFYVDDVLSMDHSNLSLYDFHCFFGLKAPTNPTRIILSKMTSDLSENQNRFLFNCALCYANGDALNGEEMRKIATNFGFEEDLEKRLNPPKRDWELEDEKRNREEEEKRKKVLIENEAYFSKPDSEIQGSFNDLHFIAQMLYPDGEIENRKTLTENTKERLTRILKDSIHFPIAPELLLVNSLANSSPQARRNIDTVYCVSCSLNSDIDFDSFERNYLKYLYLNCVQHEMIKETFTCRLEAQNPGVVKEAIQEFIEILLGKFWPDQKQIFMPYVREVDNIDRVKKLIKFYGFEEKVADRLLENLLEVLSFKILEKDLTSLSNAETNAKNNQTILALLAFSRLDKESFSQGSAIALFNLFENDFEVSSNLSEQQRIDLLGMMFDQFNTEESIKHVDGLQSDKACCASFLREKALYQLSLNGLKRLKDIRSRIEDVWTYRIAHRISEFEQTQADQSFSKFSVIQLKEFIFQGAILSERAFFEEVCSRLKELKARIEDNRDNDKEPYFNSDGTSKVERDCRDEVFRCLKNMFSSYLDLTREELEADNQVDINIKYRKNPRFEVQVECKKDSNSEVYNGIKDKLIGKYLSSQVQFGVYLVFYFGDKADKELFLKKVIESIPQGYEDKISIICFDMRKKVIR